MSERHPKLEKVDTKEFEFPETVFSRDIDNRVFQGIVLQVLSRIEGIALVGGNLIDSLLGRGGQENVKGISAEQDLQSNTISIKVDINIVYGIPIPEKAEEIQSKITEEITKLTGLHVSSVHVVFKNVVPELEEKPVPLTTPDFSAEKGRIEEEYSDEF